MREVLVELPEHELEHLVELRLALLDRLRGAGQVQTSDREEPGASVDLELAAPARPRGAVAREAAEAGAEDDLDAPAAGADLRVAVEPGDDRAGVRVQPLAVQAVVEVDADVGGREHEADPVHDAGCRSRDCGLERRPGRRIGRTRHARPVSPVRNLRSPSVAHYGPPADPLAWGADLGGDALERGHDATRSTPTNPPWRATPGGSGSGGSRSGERARARRGAIARRRGRDRFVRTLGVVCWRWRSRW